MRYAPSGASLPAADGSSVAGHFATFTLGYVAFQVFTVDYVTAEHHGARRWNERDLLTSANIALSDIRQIIMSRGKKPIKVRIADVPVVSKEYSTVHMTLLHDKVMRHIVKLRNHSFAIVLVKKATYGHAYDERDTVVGAPIAISEYLGEDMILAATDAVFFARTQQGDVLRVYLAMADEYSLPLLRAGTSIKDMSKSGIYFLQSFDINIAD